MMSRILQGTYSAPNTTNTGGKAKVKRDKRYSRPHKYGGTSVIPIQIKCDELNQQINNRKVCVFKL